MDGTISRRRKSASRAAHVVHFTAALYTEQNIGIVALRENIDTSDAGRISLSRPTLACRLCVLAKRLRLCLAVPERRTVPPTSANPIRFSYQAQRR